MTSGAATQAGAGMVPVGGVAVSPSAGQSGSAAQNGGAGSAGAAPNATAGGQGGSASAGGAAGAGGGQSGSGGGGSVSGSGSAERCAEIEAEYVSELQEQISCSPNGESQCGSSAVAAPGCDCHVFIQPKDPFAIENLLNLQFDWFDADCTDPECPADCSDAAKGSCAANGRCAAP